MRFAIVHGMTFCLSHVKCVSEPVDLKSRPYSDRNCKMTPFVQPKPKQKKNGLDLVWSVEGNKIEFETQFEMLSGNKQ